MSRYDRVIYSQQNIFIEGFSGDGEAWDHQIETRDSGEVRRWSDSHNHTDILIETLEVLSEPIPKRNLKSSNCTAKLRREMFPAR